MAIPLTASRARALHQGAACTNPRIFLSAARNTFRALCHDLVEGKPGNRPAFLIPRSSGHDLPVRGRNGLDRVAVDLLRTRPDVVLAVRVSPDDVRLSVAIEVGDALDLPREARQARILSRGVLARGPDVDVAAAGVPPEDVGLSVVIEITHPFDLPIAVWNGVECCSLSL